MAKLDFDLKTEYFRYLVDAVMDNHHARVDYIPLLELLHGIPFEVVIDMDQGRVEDGAYLREKWLDSEGIYDYLYEFDGDFVSVLEVLEALADRLSFQIGNNVTGDHEFQECFWEILRNLDLEKYSADNFKPLNVKEKVRIWMARKFRKDGFGSPFPVKNSRFDQRKQQIWEQLQDYAMENYG
ncbi:MAG: hypothetical protein J6U54_08745 [Clostridiales bacterium]|nr:hypothetical protein [Clostridiales bacterium]